MNWLKKMYLKLAPRKPPAKSFDEIYNDIGVFEYAEEGFNIRWEHLPGFFQFVLKLKEVFPSIPGDWDITIIQPAFEANFRTIYERGG